MAAATASATHTSPAVQRAGRSERSIDTSHNVWSGKQQWMIPRYKDVMLVIDDFWVLINCRASLICNWSAQRLSQAGSQCRRTRFALPGLPRQVSLNSHCWTSLGSSFKKAEKPQTAAFSQAVKLPIAQFFSPCRTRVSPWEKLWGIRFARSYQSPPRSAEYRSAMISAQQKKRHEIHAKTNPQ